MRVAFVGAGGRSRLHAGAGTTVEETGKKSAGYDFCSYGESEKFPLKDITEDDGEDNLCAAETGRCSSGRSAGERRRQKLARFPAQSMNKPQQRRTVCF